MSELLRAHGVSFAYDQREVLRDVSITLASGEVVTLIGPNGSGKSTLLKVLLGHLRPSGSIEWEGRDIAQWARRNLARRVAYLPQSPTAEPEQRVADVLRLGRAPYWSAFGIESTRDGEVVARIAGELQLTDLLHRRMDELSGGQRQRIFIGRCLAQEPAALLLDEPNTYLDLRHQVELATIMKRLARERGVAVLMASHDLNLAAMTADRMVLLCDGRVMAAGTPDAVLRPQVLSAAYGVRIERIERAGGGGAVVVPSLGTVTFSR